LQGPRCAGKEQGSTLDSESDLLGALELSSSSPNFTMEESPPPEEEGEAGMLVRRLSTGMELVHVASQESLE